MRKEGKVTRLGVFPSSCNMLIIPSITPCLD